FFPLYLLVLPGFRECRLHCLEILLLSFLLPPFIYPNFFFVAEVTDVLLFPKPLWNFDCSFIFAHLAFWQPSCWSKFFHVFFLCHIIESEKFVFIEETEQNSFFGFFHSFNANFSSM